MAQPSRTTLRSSFASSQPSWNPRESTLFDLDVGEETTIMLELDEPRNVHTRLVIRVLDPFGAVMDESHSVWYDTD